MKNKSVISFFVNVLTGILFSFPVFSAQNNLDVSSFSVREYCVSGFQIGSDFDPEFNALPVSPNIEFGLLNVFISNSLKICKPATNKKKEISESSPASSKYQLSHYFLSDFNFINPDYVNLSYLKELKTTKMLC